MRLELIEIGKINELIVSSKKDNGYVMTDSLSDDVAFMPTLFTRGDLTINERVNVFVYIDKENSITATMHNPHAVVGEFGFMRAVESIQVGAFFDWGINKDLFVPENEQKEEIYTGDSCIIKVCMDERTEKVYGTTKIGKYIKAAVFDIKEGDKVSIIPAKEEQLGYRCIINKKYIGIIYYNEIFSPIKIGEPIDGVVKKLREDGLVDTALQEQGFKNLVNTKDKILAYLQENGGNSHLHDKSSPREIKEILGISKQVFKNTIGMLYRERKIVITKTGIKLV
jgi:uncharacterized protein